MMTSERPRRSAATSAFELACDFLTAQLVEGPKARNAVAVAARAARISWRTVERAKKKLAVNVRRVGFGRGGHWEWSLPQSSPPPIDRQGERTDDVPAADGSAGPQSPPPERFRLANDVRYPYRGVRVLLRAGRVIHRLHYDLDAIRKAGGILEPYEIEE
jgi:hypothetical protein